MKQAKFNFTITGFLISLILIGMFSMAFAMFISEMDNEYNYGDGNSSFSKFREYTDNITNETQKIRDATEISGDASVTDIIGGYFKSGYSALKISLQSFNIFDNMMDDAAEEVPEFQLFKPYIIAMVLVVIFVGVVITVLVKMRI